MHSAYCALQATHLTPDPGGAGLLAQTCNCFQQLRHRGMSLFWQSAGE
jgi:hypothetical protein